jgi:hypothetical protein
MPEHFKTWNSTVNTRPSIASNANLNTLAEPTVEVDFTGRIDEALSDLNKATDAFEGDDGKTAQAILDARTEVLRVMTDLTAAQNRLKTLEAAGSALNKYAGSVSVVESAYQKLVELLNNKVRNDILAQWYGHAVSVQSISSERKNDLRLHKKIQDLQRFVHVGNFEPKATAADLAKKSDVIGGKLVELKAYFEANQAKPEVDSK